MQDRPTRRRRAALTSAASRWASLAPTVLVLAAAALPGCRQAARDDQALAAYRAEIEQWQQQRREGLQRPEGWLTLVGLHWLDEGAQTVGSDPMSDVVLPAEAPARVGVLDRQDGGVGLDLTPGVAAEFDGAPASRHLELLPGDGDGPYVALGSLRFQAIRRGDWVGIRVRDLESPALARFAGVEFFPIDPGWRVAARFEPYDPPREALIDDATGNRQPMTVLGAVVFRHGGEELRLDAFDDGDGLFLIFADATSGKETYGAGRYLGADKPDADGKLTVDFNRAYNPPCAYTPYATCPLPPRQNRLPVAVEAGEKAYRGDAGH